jgi:hypothetical protein
MLSDSSQPQAIMGSDCFPFHSVCWQLRMSEAEICKKAEGTALKPVCLVSCQDACDGGLGAYDNFSTGVSGYRIDSEDEQRLKKSCVRQCTNECIKPGKTSSFDVVYRSK